MSDVTGYILVLGLVIIGGYAAVQLCIAILRAGYLNQSLLLAFPFF